MGWILTIVTRLAFLFRLRGVSTESIRTRFGSDSRRSGWNVSTHLIRSRTKPSIGIKGCGDVVIARVIFHKIIHTTCRGNRNDVDLLAASTPEFCIWLVCCDLFPCASIQAVTDNLASAAGLPGKSDRVVTIE